MGAYTNGITDQNVQYPNRFKINGVSQTIEPDFGVVTEPGTPVNRELITEILAAKGTTSGTPTALTLAQPGFSLFDGAVVRIKLHADTEAGVTLDVNSTGAKAIETPAGLPFTSGAIAGAWLTLIYSAAVDAWVSAPENPKGVVIAGYVFYPEFASATLPSSEGWQSVTYGDGKFVAVAYNSDKVAYSGKMAVLADTSGNVIRIGEQNVIYP